MIALSCGIKISAVHYVVLSQCIRVTDRRTDGQNYDSQDRPRICSRGKKLQICFCPNFVKFPPILIPNFDNLQQKDGKEAKIM